jgi:hypothetical protein
MLRPGDRRKYICCALATEESTFAAPWRQKKVHLLRSGDRRKYICCDLATEESTFAALW